MAYQASELKLKAVAQAYVTNGYKKVEALKAAGYKTSYAEHGGLKLFDNIRLITLIDEYRAKLEVKSDYTREQHLLELEALHAALLPAIAQGNVTAIRTACTIRAEIGNSTGLHSQTINSTDEQVAKPLSAAEREELNRLANIKLKQCTG